IDVRSPVKKGVEIARSRYGINGKVELETSLPSNLPRVLGDETALAEAIAHLLANAAEASADRSKPRITLSAKPVREGRHSAAVVVTFQDNGTGIAPEIKEKIFSPFCTTKPRGMGLGLPIVKRTVFDHHGRVEVDSTSKGTQVSVLLPTTSGSDEQKFELRVAARELSLCKSKPALSRLYDRHHRSTLQGRLRQVCCRRLQHQQHGTMPRTFPRQRAKQGAVYHPAFQGRAKVRRQANAGSDHSHSRRNVSGGNLRRAPRSRRRRSMLRLHRVRVLQFGHD